MAITRRTFLVGSLALVGTAAAAAGPMSAAPLLPLSGPVFRRGTAHEAPADWLEVCAFHSDWQIDANGFAGRTVIRHRSTGITYALSFDVDGTLIAQQVDFDFCPCDEANDPDFIVGHSARLVAELAWPIIGRHGGRFFLCYRFLSEERHWEPITAEAPPITFKPPLAYPS